MTGSDTSDSGMAFGSNLLSTGLNMFDSYLGRQWQEEQAEIDRDWQEKMYQRQLDDSIDWRTHQEQYNSPEAKMQRYRDAGINPMYAVTGGSGTTITQPFSASSGGFKTNTPQAYGNKQYSLDYAQIINQSKVADAQAADYQASARMKNAEAAHKEFENGVDSALQSMDFGGKSYNEFRAEVKANALKYEHEFAGLEFEDKKKALLHNEAVRNFVESLHPDQQELFKQQVNEAKSLADIAEIRKNWEKTNQWVGLGTDILGALAAFIGSTKGMRFNPVWTNSETPYVNERHYYGDTYNNINN